MYIALGLSPVSVRVALLRVLAPGLMSLGLDKALLLLLL